MISFYLFFYSLLQVNINTESAVYTTWRLLPTVPLFQSLLQSFLQIKSNQIKYLSIQQQQKYYIDVVLYICNKLNVNGYKLYEKFTDGGGGQDSDESLSVCNWGPSEHILRGTCWCLDYNNWELECSVVGTFGGSEQGQCIGPSPILTTTMLVACWHQQCAAHLLLYCCSCLLTLPIAGCREYLDKLRKQAICRLHIKSAKEYLD